MNSFRGEALSSSNSDSSYDPIYTPSGSISPLPPSATSTQHHSIALQTLSNAASVNLRAKESDEKQIDRPEHEHNLNDKDMSGRPPQRRPSGGAFHHKVPLLKDTRDKRGRSSGEGDTIASRKPPHAARRDTFRSRSPKLAKSDDQTRKRYIYAAFFLVVSLVSFVVQTETAVYIQHKLHWNKAYCMLWLTHSSWSVLWPIQLLVLRFHKRKQPWSSFWLSHKSHITQTAQMVQTQDLHTSRLTAPRHPWRHMIKTTAFITIFLTVAGGSWYVAVDLTTPSDLTAIYNCSAFFAYVFSILLLKEKARLDKMISVALAILGVLVVAYGDSGHPKHGSHSGGATNPKPEEGFEPDNRTLGNLIIGIGSVMYGLYEVLYKKYACPPEGTSPTRGMLFANTFGSLVGSFTFCVLWLPLPILHFTGIERFELPTGQTAALLAISTLSNAVFSGSFLILMSLTSPVLSSVAALLTIFLVALTDYFITGEALSTATVTGGIIIIFAFLLLSWATYREMTEGEKKRETDESKNFDEGEAMLDDDRALDEDEFSEDEFGLSGKRRDSR